MTMSAGLNSLMMEVAMGRSGIGGLTLAGAALVLVGLIAFAIPVFTTQETKDVARVGDLKLQTTENHSFVIPPLVSGGALVLGFVLIGAGFYQKQ
jgi:predicted permease